MKPGWLFHSSSAPCCARVIRTRRKLVLSTGEVPARNSLRFDTPSPSESALRGEVPAAVRRSMELWVGCVAGALEESEFHGLLRDVGFAETAIEPTRIYHAADAAQFLSEAGLDRANLEAIEGKFMAAFVRATKPNTTPR